MSPPSGALPRPRIDRISRPDRSDSRSELWESPLMIPKHEFTDTPLSAYPGRTRRAPLGTGSAGRENDSDRRQTFFSTNRERAAIVIAGTVSAKNPFGKKTRNGIIGGGFQPRFGLIYPLVSRTVRLFSSFMAKHACSTKKNVFATQYTLAVIYTKYTYTRITFNQN